MMPGGLVGAGLANVSYSWPFLGGGRLSAPLANNRYQGDNIPCEQVILRAHVENSGLIWIGGPDVLQDMNVCLQAGDWSPYLPIQNINQLYYIAESAGDWIGYLIFGSPR